VISDAVAASAAMELLTAIILPSKLVDERERYFKAYNLELKQLHVVTKRNISSRLPLFMVDNFNLGFSSAWFFPNK
jgi:hypothetical protein